MIFSVEKDECLLGEKLRRPFRILGAWNKNLSTLATNDRHCTVYTTLLLIIIIKIDSYVFIIVIPRHLIFGIVASLTTKVLNLPGHSFTTKVCI